MHIAQQMPLPLTVSCSSKSRLVLPFLVLPFWYLLTRVVPDKFQKSRKMVVCVCVCIMSFFETAQLCMFLGDYRMFAHILLLITIVSCMFFLVWESLPYRSLVTDKINFAYDYIIGNIGLLVLLSCVLFTVK